MSLPYFSLQCDFARCSDIACNRLRSRLIERSSRIVESVTSGNVMCRSFLSSSLQLPSSTCSMMSGSIWAASCGTMDTTR